jgi:hypothetical protein
LTPDSYVEEANNLYNEENGLYNVENGLYDEEDDWYDEEFDPDDEDDLGNVCPPYMKIYRTARSICKEQHNIVEEGIDLTLISSVLRALPRLKEVRLDFCPTVHGKEWLNSYSYLAVMAMAEKSHEHHIRVVSSAIQSAGKSGISINTLSLLGFDFPCHWHVDLRTLLGPLRELLDCVQILRLTRSESALELLSHSALKFHQLDMCGLWVQHTTLKDFLETNKKSIRSIGFHDVRIFKPDWLESAKLSSSTICSMLHVPQSTPVREDDCGCFSERGQRLLLNDDYPLYSATTKRKFTQIRRRFESQGERAEPT